MHAIFAILLLSFFSAKSGGCPSPGRPFVIWARAGPQTVSQQFRNVLFRVSRSHISDAFKPESLKSLEGRIMRTWGSRGHSPGNPPRDCQNSRPSGAGSAGAAFEGLCFTNEILIDAWPWGTMVFPRRFWFVGKRHVCLLIPLCQKTVFRPGKTHTQGKDLDSGLDLHWKARASKNMRGEVA